MTGVVPSELTDCLRICVPLCERIWTKTPLTGFPVRPSSTLTVNSACLLTRQEDSVVLPETTLTLQSLNARTSSTQADAVYSPGLRSQTVYLLVCGSLASEMT